jgi:D-alanine-D-alanine ligase
VHIALLAGGRSAEREVSQRSGANVMTALQSRGHRVELIEMDLQAWDRLRDGGFNCVFIALHGRMGEDGTVQGMLELLNLPYTGSGVLASALCIDKTKSNSLLASAGLNVPEFEEVDLGEGVPAGLAERLETKYGLPLVVKPVREGSTIGLTIARNPDELASGLVDAGHYDRRVMVQRFQEGVEITVGVLATPALEVLPTLEITFEDKLYSYYAKYTPGKSHHIIPARISPQARDRAAEAAGKAFQLLGCEGMGRIDFIIGADDTPWVLEVNTIPGLTELSLLPDAARAAGIEFDELCDRLVRHAVDRHRGRSGP